MDVRTLSTFSVAARTLSFTNAAATLGCAQSSVTAQMKSLEEDLGSALFNRVGNRLELTEPGQRFLVYAERILALTQEAKASINDEAASGTVRFTAPESICTYLLPPLLKSFKAKYPLVRIQFLPGFVRDFKRNVLLDLVSCNYDYIDRIVEKVNRRSSALAEANRELPESNGRCL